MRPFMIACSLLGLATQVAGCDDTPDVSAAPPVAVRVPYDLYGVPGPWWRDNASQTDFDHDMWACRTESKRARSTATPETRKDVVYRTFLDCMTDLTWTRGYPQPAGSAGVDAAGTESPRRSREGEQLPARDC